MISLTKDNRMLGYESFDSCPDIFHFVTTRKGGCGQAKYSTFNCSPYCGDDPAIVAHNQSLLLEALPLDTRLIIPVQTHGTQCLHVDRAFLSFSSDEKSKLLQGVDALITSETGCCICISTADCIPVLLYDRKNQAVAAIHAGWRGTVDYIVLKTLELMQTTFGTIGEDVIASIGPGISIDSFEVGEEVYEAFKKNNFDMSRISVFKKDAGKHHIDLWEANRLQLLDFGVPPSQIELAGICTYIHHDQFFSARRLGIKSGRILSGIGLITK